MKHEEGTSQLEIEGGVLWVWWKTSEWDESHARGSEHFFEIEFTGFESVINDKTRTVTEAEATRLRPDWETTIRDKFW